MKRKHASGVGQRGIVLLETLIAILIFSIGILALVGVQAIMISNAADARYRSEANFIAQKRIAEIWADPSNLASFDEPAPGLDISATLPKGRRTTVQTSPGEFMVTVSWQPPGDPDDPVVHQHVAIARVAGG